MICRGNLAVVRLDDGAYNRKPHAHALRFRGEKRIEDVLEIIRRNTGTGVANPDFREGTGKVREYTDFALLCLSVRYRVHRVNNQIQNDLL